MDLSQLGFCQSLAGEALLAADLPDDPLAAAERLRRECSGPQASAVLEVRAARKRAAGSGKVPPEWAAKLLADRTMLAQASSIRLARTVGQRLADAAGGGPVLDLCCGMGLDAIGTALAGSFVRGYDLSPSAVFCAIHNASIASVAARCQFDVADVMGLLLEREAVVHIDPDRRADGRRHLALAGYAPPESYLRELPGRTRAGAAKLSPAVDRRALADWPAVRLEYISEGGVCRQLVAWWGAAGPTAARQATVIGGDWHAPQATSLPAGQADAAEVDKAGPYILEPDPAIIAAGAVDDLAAALTDGARRVWRMDERLDWLTADAPADAPLVRSFRVLREVAARVRDIAAAVRELSGGTVEVKPRGVQLDTDSLQRQLAGLGDRPLVVLWGRLGAAQRAFIAERVDRPR